MEQRNINEIQVNWQLGLFIVAIFALPISLIPPFTAMSGNLVPRSVLNVSVGIAAGSLVLMVIAVWSRVRQARREQLPDGRPLSRWVLRQVAVGLLLFVAGAGILMVLVLVGASERFAVIGCTVAAGPGVLIIGRALAPAK